MISNTQTPIHNYKFRSIWRKCMKGKLETWVACQRFLRESLRPHIVDMNRGEGNSQAALRKERQTHAWRSETGRCTSSLALKEGCRSLVRKKSNTAQKKAGLRVGLILELKMGKWPSHFSTSWRSDVKPAVGVFSAVLTASSHLTSLKRFNCENRG